MRAPAPVPTPAPARRLRPRTDDTIPFPLKQVVPPEVPVPLARVAIPPAPIALARGRTLRPCTPPPIPPEALRAALPPPPPPRAPVPVPVVAAPPEDPALSHCPSPFGADAENEDLLAPYRVSAIEQLASIFRRRPSADGDPR